MAQRYALIDGIRGLAIVNMILYHAIWDLVYLYGFDWQWYLGPVGRSGSRRSAGRSFLSPASACRFRPILCSAGWRCPSPGWR